MKQILLIFAAGFADNNHACGTRSVMFLAYIHGTKVHIFWLAPPKTTRNYDVTH